MISGQVQVLAGAMKSWEVKLVGFLSPWWFLLLVGFPGLEHRWREPVGVLGLAVGSLWALWALAADAGGRAREAATWFLLGLASIPALLILGVVLSALWAR